ncbi:MAG: hydroxyacid dehydrogenase [Acidimicrobiales bacterium]
MTSESTLPELWFERGIEFQQMHLLEGVARPTGPELDELTSATGAIAGAGYQWTAEFFDTNAPNLRVLARSGIGVDMVDIAACTERGILFANAPDGPTVSTAEHAITLMLNAAKRVPNAQRRLREQLGNFVVDNTGIELDGLTLGVVGYGRIGKRVVPVARALGMNVLICDPYVDHRGLGITHVPFEELLPRCDVLTLHCPLDDDTEHMMNHQSFAAMKPGAVFVNVARGGLVDQDALVAALDSEQISVAGLDVTVPEPLPADHPLLLDENVIVTPHIASSTTAGKVRMYDMAVQQALTGMAGERPSELLNPEVLDL